MPAEDQGQQSEPPSADQEAASAQMTMTAIEPEQPIEPPTHEGGGTMMSRTEEVTDEDKVADAGSSAEAAMTAAAITDVQQ